MRQEHQHNQLDKSQKAGCHDVYQQEGQQQQVGEHQAGHKGQAGQQGPHQSPQPPVLPQPVVPPVPHVLLQPIISEQMAMNWSYSKPKFPSKLQEDPEAHLLKL